MNRKPRFAAAVAVSMLAATCLPTAARAEDDVAVCVKASDAGQALRDKGTYTKAREQFLLCSREVCPGVVKKDCAQWLAELTASTPSVVLGAKDAQGRDVTDVRVTMDGEPLADHLDGKPVSVDPGQHVFRFEREGTPPVAQTIVVRAGEKNRDMTAQLAGAPASAPAPAAVATNTDVGSLGPEKKTIPPVAYVLGGIGVVGVAGFVVFGLSGKNQVDGYRAPGGCAPNCNPSDVSTAKTKLTVADISLGVGIVSLGFATYLVIANLPSDKPRPPAASARIPSVDLAPLPGGGYASIGGRF